MDDVTYQRKENKNILTLKKKSLIKGYNYYEKRIIRRFK